MMAVAQLWTHITAFTAGHHENFFLDVPNFPCQFVFDIQNFWTSPKTVKPGLGVHCHVQTCWVDYRLHGPSFGTTLLSFCFSSGCTAERLYGCIRLFSRSAVQPYRHTAGLPFDSVFGDTAMQLYTAAHSRTPYSRMAVRLFS